MQQWWHISEYREANDLLLYMIQFATSPFGTLHSLWLPYTIAWQLLVHSSGITKMQNMEERNNGIADQRNSRITELDIKMLGDSYANKSHWRVLLPRKVWISNEKKGNRYIDNCLEVVCAEMLLWIKTAANRSFLAQKLEKGTVQPTIHSTAEPPSLAEVENHPILCPDSMIATCNTTYLVPTPSTRQAFGSWGGGINWRCVWGGGWIALPPWRWWVWCMHVHVCHCVWVSGMWCVCVCMRARAKMSGVCMWCVCICAFVRVEV